MPPKPSQPSDSAIDAHLSMTQNVINRMAANSSACKAWCVTLVSALLVMILDKGKPQFLPLAYIPALLFLGMDFYYLFLEKRFRNSYNTFIDKLHKQELKPNDLYVITPSGSKIDAALHSARSVSIWLFYGAMIFFIHLSGCLAN